ncbi:arginine deiminase-related protein [Flavicella sediminum]|uniref:arginine deiminase-related protein n=1 Tax=Flavicella sediminum TaxID=2585141 RepID=UPI00111CBDD0|nr:arginine deiminase-related protein [Flavicella sediminum]
MNTILLSVPKSGIVTTAILESLDSLQAQLESFGFSVIKVVSKGNRFETVGVNNWISFHKYGAVAVYPLTTKEAQNDRNDLLFSELESNGVSLEDIVDYTEAETEGYFLEGKKSFVTDPVNQVAFASISKCTDEDLFIEFCEDFEYTPIVFSSMDAKGCTISYTSDVLMIGENFALLVSSFIKDKKERKLLLSQLKKEGKEIIFLTEQQYDEAICSVVELRRSNAKNVLLVPEKSQSGFTKQQLAVLKKYNELLFVDGKSKDIENHLLTSWVTQIES